MKKLVYFHGFMSSAQSSKIKMLRDCLEDFEVIAPDIPVDPVLALPFLKELCQHESPDVVLGKCMGGMYAQQMFGFRRICINPAFYMSQDPDLLKVGSACFFNDRYDGTKRFFITQKIIAHFLDMEKHQFDGINSFDRENVYGLFIENDKVEDYMLLFQKHYKHCQYFPYTCRVDSQFISTIVAPLVRIVAS